MPDPKSPGGAKPDKGAQPKMQEKSGKGAAPMPKPTGGGGKK
jgi:hypothetical protein